MDDHPWMITMITSVAVRIAEGGSKGGGLGGAGAPPSIPTGSLLDSRTYVAVLRVVGENILGVFLAVPRVVGKNILGVFLAVPTVVGENILDVRYRRLRR